MEISKEKAEKLEISKGAKIAAKWWADRLDGTVAAPSFMDMAQELKRNAETSYNDEWKRLVGIFCDVVSHVESKGSYISQEQSQKLRENLENLLQKSINQRKIEWLATDEDHACGYLGVACYLSGIDHENLPSLPLNVMMYVSADKVEIEYQDFMRSEVVFDAKQEAILRGGKQADGRNI